jgi:hypothetical protein
MILERVSEGAEQLSLDLQVDQPFAIGDRTGATFQIDDVQPKLPLGMLCSCLRHATSPSLAASGTDLVFLRCSD